MKLEMGSRTLIMGILNTTPDSFSDGGHYVDVQHAVDQAGRMLEQGADILDIGGESTRPGAEPVALKQELERVIPAIKAIQATYGAHIPISIDTYKAEVARQALAAGAHIINDVWGFKKDPEMAKVAAEFGCPVILMHNRNDMNYVDFIEDVIMDLSESVRIAKQAGVAKESIVLDPGIGFAKTFDQNLYLLNQLQRITDLGFPVLLGTSRKRFIQRVLQTTANDALEGTVATTVLGIMQGCEIIRVHDVKANKRAATMTDAMVRSIPTV
ncbi:dihydropteroate synthase [Paenibacillus swuensis]|uniref:Dihydropteroate synthase n=2 Tax=Paenibacillus swuensis TaxID=1178515 RepID=A0A172TFY3_9BACL|nr:dihydropteroate synthase [Paenibacillus swuensis]